MRLRALPLALLFLVFPAHHLSSQQCPARGPTALVLSGGGSKGLAHIGVLETLDSLGVRPDLVVGTSMGAVIAGMYASGVPGRVIDSLARSLPLTNLFRFFDPVAPRALGSLQPLAVWEGGERGFITQTPAVVEPRVNALLNAALLRGNLIARGDFDRLPIPLRVVATDLDNGERVVLSGGDLAQAVRASVAIPFLFVPEKIDGRFLADGGLSANIPVSVAREAGAWRVIVSDATEGRTDEGNLYSPLAVAGRLLGGLFEQRRDSLFPDDIYIRSPVAGLVSLDFSRRQMDSVVALGRAAARGALGNAACLPAAVPSIVPIPSVVSRVQLTNGASRELRALEHQLAIAAGDSVNVALLRRRLRELGESDRYVALWLNPSGTDDSVAFDLRASHVPSTAVAFGAAYDNDLGGRAWTGAMQRDLVRTGITASLLLTAGNFAKDLTLAFRRPTALWGQTLTPVLSVTGATENVRTFDGDGERIGQLRTRELRGSFGFEHFTRGGAVVVGTGIARTWRRPDSTTASALGVHVAVEAPFGGDNVWLRMEGEANTSFRVASLDLSPVVPLQKRVTLRPRLRVGAGSDLPLQHDLLLGGQDGLPGYHIGELRGDRELFGSVEIDVALMGPLELQVEGAAGRIATGGPLWDRDGWLAGGRAGIGAETPLGRVRLAAGFADGREQLFVRLGRWF